MALALEAYSPTVNTRRGECKKQGQRHIWQNVLCVTDKA